MIMTIKHIRSQINDLCLHFYSGSKKMLFIYLQFTMSL